MTYTPIEPPVNPPVDETGEPTEIIERPVPEDFDPDTLYEQLAEAGLAMDPELPPQPWAEFRIGQGENIQFRFVRPEAAEQVDAILAEHPEKARANKAKRQTARTNDTTISDDLRAALEQNKADRTENDAYLAKTTPTANEQERHIKTLTRQSSRQARMINGIIRKQLGELGATD
jgi:hypothetical protein